MHPNLVQRPAKPALGRGRIQKLARRAMWAFGGQATTAQVLQWTSVRKLVHGRRIEPHDYRDARRALARIADAVGRTSGGGRPMLWRLRPRDPSGK
jgi:hypothetical protein